MSPTQWNPVTATNINGIRLVAWQQSNGSGDDIWAIRHVPGAVATSIRVATFPSDYISELNVFIDDDGNAFVTWVVDKAPFTQPRHIWANRFVAGSGSGSGWGTAQVIDGYAKRSGTNLHLKFDHAGNALALWQEYDCCAIHSLQSIVANRYTRTNGWSKPVRLDDSYSFLAGRIDLKTDASGNAYASWSTITDIHFPKPKLMVSHYTLNAGWNTPQIIAIESILNTTGYQTLAVNSSGEAFLMWTDDTGLKYARADAVGNWSAPALIDSTATISPSQMVLLDNGEAFAVFINGAKRFMPDKSLWSWTHPLLPDQDASSEPNIVADDNGNALVAWTQNVVGINRIYAKRYRTDKSWLSAIPIDSDDSMGSELEELFLERNGDISAAWRQSNDTGTIDIQTARFVE